MKDELGKAISEIGADSMGFADFVKFNVLAEALHNLEKLAALGSAPAADPLRHYDQ